MAIHWLLMEPIAKEGKKKSIFISIIRFLFIIEPFLLECLLQWKLYWELVIQEKEAIDIPLLISLRKV